MPSLLRARNNIQPEVAEESHDPVDVAHASLVVSSLALAVEEEGISYLDSSDGQDWLGILGLDAEAIRTRLLRRINNADTRSLEVVH